GAGYPPGGPGYPAPYPPQPQSTCELAAEGRHGGFSYKYRLLMNGQSMEGSDHLDTILNRLDQYQRDGLCGRAYPKECTLAGEGRWAGFTYKFRPMLAGVV